MSAYFIFSAILIITAIVGNFLSYLLLWTEFSIIWDIFSWQAWRCLIFIRDFHRSFPGCFHGLQRMDHLATSCVVARHSSSSSSVPQHIPSSLRLLLRAIPSHSQGSFLLRRPHHTETDGHLHFGAVDFTNRNLSWPISWLGSLRVQTKDLRLWTAVGKWDNLSISWTTSEHSAWQHKQRKKCPGDATWWNQLSRARWSEYRSSESGRSVSVNRPSDCSRKFRSTSIRAVEKDAS